MILQMENKFLEIGVFQGNVFNVTFEFWSEKFIIKYLQVV